MKSSDLAARGQYCDAIIELVRELGGGVSFWELKKLLKPYMDVDGRICMYKDEYPNIITWAGMSQAFLDSVLAALETKTVEMRPTSTLVYFVDGGGLNMPLVRSVRQYKEPHWLPVCFHMVGGKKTTGKRNK